MNEQLANIPPDDGHNNSPIPVARLIQAVIEKAMTAESVGVVERLVALHERMDARAAERLFAAAFVALQSELSPVAASKAVPNNDGSIRYKFAPFEDIMEHARPLLQKNGFTVTFSMSFSDGRIIQKCTLQHVGGHSRTNEFAARIGKGPPGSSEAQGDGAASTYAKRFAFCNALNIVTDTDTDGALDAKAEGELISSDKIQFLTEQLKETGGSLPLLLKMAGVEKLEEIRNGSYPVLVRALQMKAKK